MYEKGSFKLLFQPPWNDDKITKTHHYFCKLWVFVTFVVIFNEFGDFFYGQKWKEKNENICMYVAIEAFRVEKKLHLLERILNYYYYFYCINMQPYIHTYIHMYIVYVLDCLRLKTSEHIIVRLLFTKSLSLYLCPHLKKKKVN